MPLTCPEDQVQYLPCILANLHTYRNLQGRGCYHALQMRKLRPRGGQELTQIQTAKWQSCFCPGGKRRLSGSSRLPAASPGSSRGISLCPVRFISLLTAGQYAHQPLARQALEGCWNLLMIYRNYCLPPDAGRMQSRCWREAPHGLSSPISSLEVGHGTQSGD